MNCLFNDFFCFMNTSVFINNVPEDARHQPLVLKKQATANSGHVWSLQVCDGSETEADLKGKKLNLLFRAVAEGAKLNTELSALGQDNGFRILSQQKTKMIAIKQRTFGHSKAIGKGLEGIRRQGEGYTGRMVDPSYWLAEIVQGGKPRIALEVYTLKDNWEAEGSSLSFAEWEPLKHEKWQRSGSPMDFMVWLATETAQLKEIKAWEREGTSESFESWKAKQEDPDLGIPLWEAKKRYEEDKKASGTNLTFEEWKKEGSLPWLENESKEFNEKYGLQLTPREFDKKLFEYANSGFIGTLDHFLLKEMWESEGKPEDLKTYLDKRVYTQELATGKTVAETLSEWKQTKERALITRHQGSHLPLSLESYKKTQVSNPLAEASPFVLLGAEERKIYQTTCQGGMLTRNGHPFDTAYERTEHSKDGYAIFVIGSKKDLYCGSHIRDLFHHSSFLGESAVAAAGEVKTDASGKVIELSAKSGHYKPADTENRYLLRYFQERGVDLSAVRFTYFAAIGTGEANAADYLQRLETGGLSEVETDLFA